MATLTNTKIKDTYPGLLKTTDNAALGGTYKLITDGLGNSSGVYLGTGGNVGIGAATPDDGDLQIGDSNTSFNLSFAGPRSKFGYDGTNTVVQGGTSKGIKFCVNNATFGSGEVMRIKDSNGYVGIGEIDPQKPLTIKKDQSETAIMVQSSDTGLSGIYLGGITDSIKGGLILDNSDNSLQLRGYNNATRLFVKSDGNVGIGTTTPGTFKLDVAGSARSNFFALRLNQTLPSESSAIYRPATGTFAIVTAAAERMRIDSSGYVGIGVTNPSSFFNQARNLVVGGSGNVGATIYSSTSGNTFLAFADVADGVNSGFNAGGSIYYEHANDAMVARVNGSERMRIDSSGNVGINYENPQQKLEVSGASRFSRTGAESAQYMEFLPISGGNILKAVGSSKSLIFDNTSSTTNEIHFRQGGSNKMIIKSGVVLVGKTSSGANTVGCELNPVGLSQFTRDGNLPLLVNRKSSDGTIVSIRRDNVQRGSISVSGSTTSYNTSSDYRLKENVVDLTGALDRIEQLQPKRFNFISEETTVDGFIAHEVQSVIPEAVFGEKDAVDEDGNPEYQGIDKSKIVPLLVGAIKELKAEIETLKSQINS